MFAFTEIKNLEIRTTCVLKCFCCYSSGKEKTLLIGDGKDNIPSSSHRNVLSQPLIISGHGTNARINVRKLNELAHHLATADRIIELREKVGRSMRCMSGECPYHACSYLNVYMTITYVYVL